MGLTDQTLRNWVKALDTGNFNGQQFYPLSPCPVLWSQPFLCGLLKTISTIELQQVTPPSSTHFGIPDSVIAPDEQMVAILGEGYSSGPIRQIRAEHLGWRHSWVARLWNVVMFQAWLESNQT